ncbi:MAG: hypothetical protein KF812_10220, partial [Fimbriimonadaceae bacterium]|nr:hypothetical protein [Fimbriimonadaceae bacterium]
SGESCIKFTFSGATGWAGIAFQFPSNDWGDLPQSINLTGAKKLTFWMRGANGNEEVKVEFGIIKSDKPHPDSASGKMELTLTPSWKQYSIDLAGKDLSRIKTGFVITFAGAGSSQTVFLDDVRYE